MATKNEISVRIVAGPSERQLVESLVGAFLSILRFRHSRIGGKMTSVRFTTDGKEPAVAVVFRACVTGMSREGGSDNGWNIEGYLFDHPNVAGFKGCYNGKTREGLLILALR